MKTYTEILVIWDNDTIVSFENATLKDAYKFITEDRTEDTGDPAILDLDGKLLLFQDWHFNACCIEGTFSEEYLLEELLYDAEKIKRRKSSAKFLITAAEIKLKQVPASRKIKALKKQDAQLDQELQTLDQELMDSFKSNK